MLFTRVLVLILSTLTLLTTAQIPTPTPTPTTLTPTSITDAQATHILDDLNAYISLLLPDPEITAVVSLLATAAPASVLDDLRADPIGYLEFWLAQTTTTPSWVSATLPTPYQAYWLSVQSVEASIIAQDLKAAAATTEATVVTVVEGAPAVTTVVTAGAVGAARIAVEAVGAAVAVGAAGMALL
ncbi:MAG: hypothetical protein ASARMPRED_007712 [Alectoria sarmentosa]|nr:MAG: hypothetical protein ASARMPRED_007712 [Alectoria sarmentosa]